jgi:uncharacterized membrane protein YqjE
MSAQAPSPGLVASLRRLLAHVAVLLATRAELAALELQQLRARIVRWAVLIVLAAVLALAALMTVSVWVAAVFWDGPRGWVLGLLALAYLAIAAALLLALQRSVERSPPLLSLTRDELLKDLDALRSRAGAADEGPANDVTG